MKTPSQGFESKGRSLFRGGRRAVLLLFVAVCTLLPCSAAAPADLRGPEQDLLHGRADQAAGALHATLMREPQNAAAHLLLCRVLLTEEIPVAAQECDAALKSGLAQDSHAQDWAGRAYGLRAEHAGPVAGLKLAIQVRAAFEAAYRLDDHNPAAANDLGEFYIKAPFLVGGGVEKAAALADSIQGSLPATAHRLRALIAEKRGDLGTAEREFVAETNVEQSPAAWVDVAVFYMRQNRPDKGIAAARRAIALDRKVSASAVDAASSLHDMRQTAEAVPVLREYIARGDQSDLAPVFRVHTLLGQISAEAGDKNAARREFQQALAIAAGYQPAQKGLGAL